MLSRRLGLEEEDAARLQGDELTFGSEALFSKAFELAPENPTDGATMLGVALLCKAHETKDGRLKSSLLLLARLVANADGNKVLGPEGSELRHELLPTGWKEMADSWQRLRYAWREGLVKLLDPDESEASTVEALDELTRMHSNEPEPVSVNIQEVWPSPWISFAVSGLGLAISIRAMASDYRRGNRRK